MNKTPIWLSSLPCRRFWVQAFHLKPENVSYSTSVNHAACRRRPARLFTVLLGEQNVTFALPYADRVYVLEHARIVWEGTPGRFAAEAGTRYL